MKMENAVKTILSRIDASNLPAVPRVLLDLMAATQRPNVSFEELAKIIAQDASLSSKVLTAANSPFYRQRGEITDLNRVLIVLGLTTLKTIAITRAVQQFFAQLTQTHQSFLEIIWYRSLTCAHLARKLASLTAYDFPDEAYLSGLVHRLGQLVLLECFPKEYPDILIDHFDGQQIAVEKKLFGASHNEVGAYLIDSWRLQSFIADAVHYQYQQAETIADGAKLIKIINLASQLSSIDTGKKYSVFAAVDTLFGLNQSLIEEMLGDVRTLVEQTAGSLGISIADADGNGIKNLTTAAQRNAVQKFLGEQVKEIALAAVVHQQLESSLALNRLVTTIRRDMSVLFGIHVAAVFIYREEAHCLEGVAGEQEQDSLWPTISVGLEPGHSLLAKALRRKEILHSFNNDKTEPETIVDRQICRLLGTEGMLLIPMSIDESAIGVIAAGLESPATPIMKANLGFIALFAGEAAQALHHRQSSNREGRQTDDKAKSAYQLHARKLAHEINNPLSIINNYLYLLGLKLGKEDADEIRIIQEEINRVGKLVLRLPDCPEDAVNEDNSSVDVNALILDLARLFKLGILQTHAINLNVMLDDSIPQISSSRNKLKQILINLMKNAAEAMPNGGSMTISTKDSVYLGKKCYMEIKLSDTGPGLPEEIRRHLFNPVKSTKGKQHPGLGLAISKSLVDELGGTIIYSSSPGDGTIVQILLPK